MKQTIMMLTALMAAASAHAESYDYLTIACSDGTKQTLTAVGLEMTFANGKLIATNPTTGETATLTLADLAKMYFTTDKTGDEVGVLPLDRTGAWGIDEAEAIYDLAGREMQRTALRPGIYVIKKGSETKKVQVR